MGGDNTSATIPPSQKSVKAYVDAQLSVTTVIFPMVDQDRQAFIGQIQHTFSGTGGTTFDRLTPTDQVDINTNLGCPYPTPSLNGLIVSDFIRYSGELILQYHVYDGSSIPDKIRLEIWKGDIGSGTLMNSSNAVSYTHLRAHET